MGPRVPDEYFRKRASESDDVARDYGADAHEDPRPQQAAVTQPSSDGITPRLLALILVLAMAAAFILGRLLIFTPEAVPAESPSPSAESSAVSSTGLAPYDGAVTRVVPVRAQGECRDGSRSQSDPSVLIDEERSTIWRCSGDGVGESITFLFEPSASLVGIRMVNGNTSEAQRYLAERRLLSVRWQFSDGSYFTQGLAANDPALQEVRFPEVRASSVTLMIEASTPAGADDKESDAVSISALEFLVAA